MRLVSVGKVRTIYDPGPGPDEKPRLLIVTSDRISAFDKVLVNEKEEPVLIPGKGKILNGLTNFWMRKFSDIVPNHILETDIDRIPEKDTGPLDREFLRGRVALVKKADVFPIEFIVRGYISGSAWKSYKESGLVCGQALVPGLVESQKFPEPLLTPSTKAGPGEHDENISVEKMVEIAGENARKAGEIALMLYTRASEYAKDRGIIIADTKFEFGMIDGEVVLVDEVLTPDSSRFWSLADYEPGRAQKSFDKQFLRDYIKANGDSDIPAEILEKTADKYKEAYDALVGA